MDKNNEFVSKDQSGFNNDELKKEIDKWWSWVDNKQDTPKDIQDTQDHGRPL